MPNKSIIPYEIYTDGSAKGADASNRLGGWAYAILFDGDMVDERVAIWFADAVSREDLDDDVVRRILVVYDRSSGQAVWRGRFQMDAKYEIGDVMLKASE